ncbi:MAG: hypothetical protein II865_02660 [Bacteroidales bacterium]|nr:hypothetical protein [Bacteroidales bacterium]
MTRNKLLLLLFITFPLLSTAMDTTKVYSKSSSNIRHSFSIQYNNCFFPKSKFDYNKGLSCLYSPKMGYDRAFLAEYNAFFPSNFGFSLELSQGWIGLRFANNTNGSTFSLHEFGLFSFPCLGYYGLGVKATYIYSLTNRVFIKPEFGVRISYFFNQLVEDGRCEGGDTIMYLNVGNLRCNNNFIPDITVGFSFLFHTKRNHRNNFILGLNANMGFVKRFEGYYAVRSPFSYSESVCNISATSTYFGINLGYAFVGVPKSFFRKKIN